MKVRGYAAQSADSPLAPWEFERRSPGKNDVRIRIEHCGSTVKPETRLKCWSGVNCSTARSSRYRAPQLGFLSRLFWPP